MVIATENPIGYHGTFPLPESQLDRFALQISMDYPDRETELEILYRETDSSHINELEPALTLQDVLKLQQLLPSITFSRPLANYLLSIVERTRNHPQIELGLQSTWCNQLLQVCSRLCIDPGSRFCAAG